MTAPTPDDPLNTQPTWRHVTQRFRQQPRMLLGMAVIAAVGLYGGSLLHDWLKPVPKNIVPMDPAQKEFLEAKAAAQGREEERRVLLQRRRVLLREKQHLTEKMQQLREREQAESTTEHSES